MMAAALWGWLGSGARALGLLVGIKALPVTLLALAIASAKPPPPARAAVVIALLTHAAGDLALELSLVAGLGAFLVGHLVWAGVFWRRRRSSDAMSGGDRLRLGLLAMAGAALLAVIVPALDAGMRTAVPLYAGALLAMAGTAQLSRRGRPWVQIGALLFVLSDGLLGLRLFAGLRFRLDPVWPLYVAAQLALAWGWRTGPEEVAWSDEGAEAED